MIHIQHIAVSATVTFFLPDTFGYEVHDKVKPIVNEKVIIKLYPNSFRETDLLDYLKSLHITDLVLCGIMTHICVDATTKAAKDFGLIVS